MTTPPSTSPVRRLLGLAARPLLVLVAYGFLLVLFAKGSEEHGLLTPSGSVNPGFLAMGVLALAMRAAVLFVLPLVVVYRAVRWLAREFLERRASRQN